MLADFHKTRPYSGKPSLAVDLRELVSWWRDAKDNRAEWKQKVLAHLKNLESLGTATKIWDALDDEEQKRLDQQINVLATGLERLHAAEIPLVRVDDSLFSTPTKDTTEPPLALLFKRIGSNFTKLSDEDYVYAILKQLLPDVHDMVRDLHGHRFSGDESPSVASLLTSADLAMSALRVAAAEWNSSKREKTADPENPSKEDFHRLIRHDGFLEQAFLPLLKEKRMQQWFGLVLRCLEYRATDNADAGLPRHALPHLSRPLVQVLLRLPQVDYLGNDDAEIDGTRRSDVLRLVLYWWFCVTDQHKASRIAYQVIEANRADTAPDVGRKIKEAIVAESAGFDLQRPEIISAHPVLKHSNNAQKVLGWSRFSPKPDDDADRLLCEFWRRWWWPWHYQHPILLWLQRSYVATKIGGDPIAGRDEDTPYDYDHILPQDHWGQWTGWGDYKGKRFIDFCDVPGHANVIGHSIGNIRVWASVENRSDGAAAPTRKLMLIAPPPMSPPHDVTMMASSAERQAMRSILLNDSAIDNDQVRYWFSLWLKCPRADPQDRSHRHWTLPRAKAFERAVEARAFALYERFWRELDFGTWFPSAQ